MISPNFASKIPGRLFRQYSSKIKAVLSEDVQNDIDNEKYKPRLHPGVMKPKMVQIPEELISATNYTIGDHPIKLLLKDGESMSRHLEKRMPPMEKQDLRNVQRNIFQRVLDKELKHASLDAEHKQQLFKQRVESKSNDIFQKTVYNWQPMEYDVHKSLVYLLSRFAPEYAVLVKIFNEIKSRDPEFEPRSLFDFGSGVGTAMWAANLLWKKSLFEYFNVDVSASMNDLSLSLLQGGRGNKDAGIKGVFYRQFLPATNNSYDLVVSAYSLLELPSFEARMDAIIKLWNKTEKYLVLVEHGTNAGFGILNEVRDFILQIDDVRNRGHVFSPCPHDQICPRFVAEDGTPCNFEVSYETLPIGVIKSVKRERYSYVVLKKSERSKEDPQWPRIVRQTLVRHKHVICRMCTSNGNLQEVIFTASKHGKTTYHCARSSKWGDLLPIQLSPKKEDT